MSFILECRALGYAYPGGQGALRDVTMSFAKGSRNVVLGANGAGKSTLFMLLNGVFRPTQGQVSLEGAPVTYDRTGLKRLRSQVGVLFQDPDVQLIAASVWEDVSFGPMNLGLDHATVKHRVEAALCAVQMETLADRPVHALSYGQKRRVGLAGLLAMEPSVLILDEPTSGLDHRGQTDFLTLMEGLHQQGITLILSTHAIDLAYAWADAAFVLQEGALVAQCEAAQFAQRFPTFEAYGLGLPMVITLSEALRHRGLLPMDALAPRDVGSLLALLPSRASSHP